MSMRQYFNNFLTLLKIGESGGSMLFNGSAVAPAVAGGFVSKLYFCDDVIFPATNPVWCELESSPDGTFVANHTRVSSAVYQMFSGHGYVTGPLGVPTLPGGEWSLDIYSAIASGSGQIQVNLYKVAADGSYGAPFATFETAVFSNSALAINRATKFVNTQAGWLATDRVGITILGRKISGGGTPLMTFSHDKLGGTMSTVTSPISLLHDQMFGLNAGDYQHLTQLEKTGIVDLLALKIDKYTTIASATLGVAGTGLAITGLNIPNAAGTKYRIRGGFTASAANSGGLIINLRMNANATSYVNWTVSSSGAVRAISGGAAQSFSPTAALKAGSALIFEGTMLFNNGVWCADLVAYGQATTGDFKLKHDLLLTWTGVGANPISRLELLSTDTKTIDAGATLIIERIQ